MKVQKDANLGEPFENAWPSYTSLAASTPIDQCTGMSAFHTTFEKPKETPAPCTDGEGNLHMTNDGLILEDDADSEVKDR